MKKIARNATVMLLMLAASVMVANAGEDERDSRALDVLNSMAAYTGSLDKMVIKAEVFADARLDAGLIVSNNSEVTIKVDRPGSLAMQGFDGLNTRKIYVHEGKLTLYSSENNFYSRADVPETFEKAMQFAMVEYDLDMPLAELIFADAAIELLTGQDEVLYLADKSRVRGVDCHHIAIRGDLVDLQLWIEEGDKPVARKISMTMKWEGGSPRQTALMDWSSVRKFKSRDFKFSPPEGALEIRFYGSE